MPMRRMMTIALLLAPLAGGAQDELPPGAGRETVITVCTACHELRRIAAAGFDRAGWTNVLHMMKNAGAALPDDSLEPVADYLSANFPPRPQPPAVLLAGPARIRIREWTVPTPGERPHDPLAAADGALWYSGQMASLLGRLDPASGQFHEYALPPRSGPHGLAQAADGAIWYTANFAGAIGRLDPTSGAVRQFPLPDSAARDPHTPIFDRMGRLWFTIQGANQIGRLDPATGEFRLAALPHEKSNPYGLVVDRDGTPYFAEFGANRIGRIDPATMTIGEFPLPFPDARPRRLTIGADGLIWYSDYARGRLGRLDPTSGQVREFRSPGGAASRPYGIAFAAGAVWYSESGVAPNTLVRFDPRSERFQSWAIPSGGGVVRHMVAAGEHRLMLACSGVNGVAVVEIE